jgi:hypothetical protein
MNRRDILGAAASGVAVSVAGCAGSLPTGCADTPPFDYTWEANPYLTLDNNVVVLVEGELQNQSDDCALDVVEVTVAAVDAQGETVTSTSTIVRDIAPHDEELWLVRFRPSGDDVRRFDDYEVSTSAPDSE